MALEIRQNLKLTQNLVITPQLQQAIKLLQLSRLELVDAVREEMLENPVLEEDPDLGEEVQFSEAEAETESNSQSAENSSEASSDEGIQNEVLSDTQKDMIDPSQFDWENYLNTYNAPEHVASGLEELPSYENTLKEPTHLHDHLTWQLQLSNWIKEEEEIGLLMIGEINDDGYLQSSLEELADKAQTPLEKVEMVHQKLMQFDPAGVGARTLQECLLSQVRFFGQDRVILEKIIVEHLNDLEKRDYRKIAKGLKISLEQASLLAKVIHELEPKPGRPFSSSSAQYITPDVYIYKVANQWVVVLNEDGLPKLQVSPFYRNMMHHLQSKDAAKEYIQTKLRSAIWLIKSIHQRQRTLYKVAKAILKFQEEFFEKGVSALKPMVLRDIAEEIEMHESTVSRVTTNKYVHTPQGIFELKYFFSNGLATEEGDSVASETIKEKIRQLVAQEDTKKPLSDQKIVEILKADKIDIARRTVAKYRELMGVLPSSRRKKFF